MMRQVLDRVFVEYVIMWLWIRAGTYDIGYVSSSTYTQSINCSDRFFTTGCDPRHDHHPENIFTTIRSR